jgi:acetolactate synthase I/II/III large subunit
MSSEITGADIVVRCLAEEGVEHVFGYPGGAVLYIYDAIFKQDKFQHILVRHEQAAIHAADAYSRSSNKVGVALVTSGPGVTNAVTGLVTAYMDSIPMVIISGQVPTHAIGQDAFQECDTVGITRPCVKHNFLVKDVKDLAMVMKKAFYIATTGRPGPVLVDIPKDITTAQSGLRVSERARDALLQTRRKRSFGTDPQSGSALAHRRAPHDLCRWRRDFVRCCA